MTIAMPHAMVCRHALAGCMPDLRLCVRADVTGGNVLLQRSKQGAAGFSAKIADFGMARDFSVQDRIQTRMYGTVTHMPPELIRSGTASKAVDVYALVWPPAALV